MSWKLAPAEDAAVITKHDTTNFTLGVCRGIYVGGTGDVAVVFANDNVEIFEDVPQGSLLPVRAKRVNSTGTSATLMLALY